MCIIFVFRCSQLIQYSHDKLAKVNFSKTNPIAQSCTSSASAICALWKIYECWFIPNCTRKILWLLANSSHVHAKIWLAFPLLRVTVCHSLGGDGGRGGSPGEHGAEGVRETEEERAGSEREIQKGKLSLLLLLTSSQRNEPNNVSWLSFNVLRGLTQNFIRQKSQKTKMRIRDKIIKKNQHYLLWNWKPFQLAYIIGHERDGMTHVSTVSVARVSVSSVSLAVEIFCKNDKASQVKCRQRPLFSVWWGNIRPWKTFLVARSVPL